MSTVANFRFDDETVIRVVMVDDDPWFVSGDALAILDLNRSSIAILDDDEKGVHTLHTPGGAQQVSIISESGLYSLILRSRKSEAKAIKRWFTHVVLPQIRRTGSYGTTPALTGPELVAAALVEAAQMIEARESRIHQLESARAEDAPKVTYVDTYVTDADLLSFSTVASTNNVKETWLRDLLIERDWIYCQFDSRWSEKQGKKITRNRYSEKADKKRYFRRVEVHEAPRFRGSEVMHTLKVTPQGAEAIARMIAREVAA